MKIGSDYSATDVRAVGNNTLVLGPAEVPNGM